jgi:hypothetical protein
MTTKHRSKPGNRPYSMDVFEAINERGKASRSGFVTLGYSGGQQQLHLLW